MKNRYLAVVGLAFGAIVSAGCGSEGATSSAPTADVGTVASQYTSTRYPIVLIPGIMGFTEMLGTIEYFPGIPDAIADGGGRAFVVTVSQANTSQVRGSQIIPQLDAIRALTGASKLNLVGHSQGALDARFIAATRPDLVASVTSVGGPHRGSPVADFMLGIPLGSEGLQGLADLFKLLAGTSHPNDARKALEFLGVKSQAEFARAYPAALPATPCGSGAPVVEGIRYYSWGGVGWITNPIDLLDPLWAITGLQVPEANDGMLGKCSSHLGEVIRDDYAQNHIDETNMILGLVMPLGPNPTALYRNHANRLKNAGL
jgi:triacylglycerol lipase